jgi:hypothetical protein
MHLIPVGHSKPEETCLEIGSRKMREMTPEGRLLARRELGLTLKIRLQILNLTGKMVCTCVMSRGVIPMDTKEKS